MILIITVKQNNIICIENTEICLNKNNEIQSLNDQVKHQYEATN